MSLLLNGVFLSAASVPDGQYGTAASHVPASVWPYLDVKFDQDYD
jgi:hypothetical protein